MRGLLLSGIVLTVLGIAGLVYGGVPYQQTEQILKVGPIEASTTTDKTAQIPQPVSIAVIVIGVGMIGLSLRKPRA